MAREQLRERWAQLPKTRGELLLGKHNLCSLPQPAYPWIVQLRRVKGITLAISWNRPPNASSKTKFRRRIKQPFEIDAFVEECVSCKILVLMFQEWGDGRLDAPSKPSLQNICLPIFLNKDQWDPLSVRVSTLKGYRGETGQNCQGIWAVSVQQKNQAHGHFVFINCHIQHALYGKKGEPEQLKKNEQDAILVCKEAWPRDRAGQVLAGHVVMAGD